jgi:predicted metal-dependent peptidase
MATKTEKEFTIADAEKRLNEARVRLALDHKFWGSISASLTHEVDAKTKTACTDGKRIRYGVKFISKLSPEKLVGLIAHEVAHVALAHHLRKDGRDHALWNKATDYAVNHILTEAGFEIPEGGLVDPTLGNQSSEAVYAQLSQDEEQDDKSDDKDEDKQQNDEQDGGGDGGGNDGSEGGGDGIPSDSPEAWGEVEEPKNDDGSSLSPEQKRDLEKELAQNISSAESVARMAGSLPADVARLLGLARQTKIPWTDLLRSKLVSLARDDYSYRRPNRRSSGDVFLPSLRSDSPPKVAVFIDTSGSVNEDDLATAMEEVAEASDITRLPVVVGGVDTRFHGWKEYSSGDPLPDIKGGGGTDFSEAFDHLESEEAGDVGLAVFITDGYTSDWGTAPDKCDVIWVITPANESIKPPFGDVIYADYKK